MFQRQCTKIGVNRFIPAMLTLLMTINNAWGLSLTDKKLPYASPDVTYTDSSGTQRRLDQFKGQKVMLWMFSTWCHTCVAGVKALHKNQSILERNGLKILAIRNHNNGGYPGLSMQDFMKKFGSFTLKSNNWVLGESSTDMYEQLNPVKFPDIYFLIDGKGLIQFVNTAPNLTLKTILAFSQQK